MKKLNFNGTLIGCLFGLALLLFSSCLKNDALWETEILTPLLKTKLSFEDLIQDDLRFEKDSQNLVTLVFTQKLEALGLDDLFTIRDTGLSRSFAIDSLALYTSTITYPITLGDISRQAGVIGLIILSQHGSKVAIPPIPGFSSPVFPINADTLFTSMELTTGSLDVSFTNGLPVDITNVNFELRNQSDQSLIITGIFPLIAASSTSTQTFSLDGKRIEGKMQAQLISFGSPGSNGTPVLIDTAAAIVASLKVYNLHPSSATAIFPGQNLINQSLPFIIRSLSVQLKEARIKSGDIVFNLKSTLQDSVHFTYKLPSATLNNVPLELFKTLAPATPAQPSVFTEARNFAGYHFDMSGPNKDTVNTAYNIYKASIDSSGELRTFSKADNLLLEINFKKIKPSYARGYFSSDTFQVGPEVQNFDFLNKLDGLIDFKDISMNVEIENNIGADGRLQIKTIEGVNSKKGSKIQLVSPVLNGDINIARAKDNNGQLPIIPGVHQINLNAQNSNINAFINSAPDQISYSLQLETNPYGNISNFNDFVHDGKLLSINLSMKAPLFFASSGLTLCDTIETEFEDPDVAKIKEGVLILNTENQFPLECTIQIYMLNPNNQVTDSLLITPGIIEAGKVNASGYVEQAHVSHIRIPVDKAKIDQLLATKKVKIKAQFKTKPDSSPIKIYSEYAIQFQLSGSFIFLTQ
ncbi:MAG: hypothetical protein M3Q56_04585 [Bacteroidota bacterium]|nr:hypothetical protein [Bacteroidota bacterium]